MGSKEFKNIDTTAKFSNFQILNPDFTRCKCNVMYTGRNRNYTDITDEALQKFIDRKGYANIPVVGHIRNNGHMGSHDRKLEVSNEGIKEINECVAYGVVPLDANPRFEKIIDSHGIEKDYFTLDLVLWSHYFPEVMDTKYNDEIYFNQSMEITIDSFHVDNDGYMVIKDFSMQGICLLGKSDNPEYNSEPCFEDSRVKRLYFNENHFKQNFELMLEKLKQYETDGTSTVPNKNETNPQKGVTKMELRKFAEVLSTVKTESDMQKYRLLNVDESKVFALDMEDYKPYGFEYAITTEEDTESIVIDFESKVEMSLSATEKITEENFEEFSLGTEIDKLADAKTEQHTAILNEEFDKRVDELKTSLEDLSASYSVATKKLEEYEAKEAQAKADKHANDVNAMFNQYSEKLGRCSEFLVYKAKCNPAEVTLDELNQKLTLMVGKYMMETHTKKSFSYSPTETKVNKVNKNEASSRYGNLLDKYM